MLVTFHTPRIECSGSLGISVAPTCTNATAAFIFARDIRAIQLRGVEIVVRQAETTYQFVFGKESEASAAYEKILCCLGAGGAGCS